MPLHILVLTKKFPYPLKDGESIAVHFLMKELASLGVKVDLLSMNTQKHYTRVENYSSELFFYNSIETVEIDNSIRIIPALSNLLTKQSFHIQRYNSDTFRQILHVLISKNNYDIIQLETIYMSNYLELIRSNSTAKVVLRSHNIEHRIWDRLSNNPGFSIQKHYLQNQSNRLKKYERSQIRKMDGVFFLSRVDQNYMQLYLAGIENICLPIGLDLTNYPEPSIKSNENKDFKIGCLGSLDWRPNIQGLKWFYLKVWPFLKNENISLHIAGRNCPIWIKKWANDKVFIHGEIPNASDFIQSLDINLVPLFAGSGTRVKILETMALKGVVLSTDIGIEGIEAKDGIHYLMANQANEFVRQIKWAQKAESLELIRENGRRLIEGQHDINKIALKTKSFYLKLLNDSC